MDKYHKVETSITETKFLWRRLFDFVIFPICGIVWRFSFSLLASTCEWKIYVLDKNNSFPTLHLGWGKHDILSVRNYFWFCFTARRNLNVAFRCCWLRPPFCSQQDESSSNVLLRGVVRPLCQPNISFLVEMFAFWFNTLL